jgi:site-specific recombinase XerD
MTLQQTIEQYIAYRKSLGEQQNTNGRALRSFGRAIGTHIDVADVRCEQVDAFLAGTGAATLNWHIKYSVLRNFYRYAVSRGYVTVAPLPSVIPKLPPPFVPYIYSRNDLRRLLQTVDADKRPQTCMEPATMRTILLVFYGAGLRLQEAIDLNREDVDLDDSVMTVRQTKFGKTRLVPFGEQLGRALTCYAARATRFQSDAPFFTTRTDKRVKADTLQHNHRILCDRAGVRRTDGARYQPRLHDLRHTFAVHRLTSWYQQGADVKRLLPLLSVYMGHVHLRHTQVYLTMTPELLDEAGRRFETYSGKEKSHD